MFSVCLNWSTLIILTRPGSLGGDFGEVMSAGHKACSSVLAEWYTVQLRQNRSTSAVVKKLSSLGSLRRKKSTTVKAKCLEAYMAPEKGLSAMPFWL